MTTCGCCHASLSHPVRLATHRRERATGRPRPVIEPTRGTQAARDAAATAVRGYSPPPPAVSPIRGLIDFHTHAAPDVFGRAVDDDELATMAATRQMEAVVFKNHVALTADRAWLARKHVLGASAEQALALIAAARDEGCERNVVTHAQFDVVGMNAAHMKQAAALGAKMELCALTMFVAGLQAEGVSGEQIQTMGREVPGALLMG